MGWPDSRSTLAAASKALSLPVVAASSLALAVFLVVCSAARPHPVGSAMANRARHLVDDFEGFLRVPLHYVLLDRDSKFTEQFQAILERAGLQLVRLPPKSPNCSAQLERFFRSLKDETLSRLILFGEAALCTATREFLAHYHRERAHQGLGHRILAGFGNRPARRRPCLPASAWADC